MTLVPPPGSNNAELQELLKALGLGRITARPEAITPETAALWLTFNKANRKEIGNQRAQLARDMTDGHWLVTGQPIIFGESGRLLNGQHTLGACVDSGVAIVSLVVRGIPNEDAVMGVLDSGKKRTLAHALHIAGEPHAARIAGSVNMAWRYERHSFRLVGWPSHAEGIAYLEDNGSIRQAVTFIDTVYRQVKVNPSAATVALFFNSRVDAAAAEQFWHKVGDGAGLYKGDPILALRRYMLQTAQRREKPQQDTWFLIYLKAMNLWRDGRSIQILALKPNEAVEPWDGWDA